ncbi:conserved exported hypothetical protein [Luteimonas sp. 9C]|uniref:hypothetical protein n=1 Tax=Luteimonas sp. 9C TaxID=2653148 RepID=UPI0012F3C226|nr:hypothetical protein [Luteimonas sp. 9C]VXB32821.1 conserved exported hypothetical protein [Luteimonas sp. 9C]
MPATRLLLSAVLVPLILLPAQARMPSRHAIAEDCAAAAERAPAAIRPATGIYILERFETLDDVTAQPVASPLSPDEALDPAALGQAALSTLGHRIARDIEAEIEASSRLSWVEVDADARTVVVVGTAKSGPRRAVFTPDFSCLVPQEPDTAPMRIEHVDADRFGMRVRAFATHRLTWRRVDADSAALADVRRLRDAAQASVRASDASHQAPLDTLRRAPRTLTARATLAAGQLIIALPPGWQLRAQDGGYRVVGAPGTIDLLVDPGAARIETLEREMETRATPTIATDDGVRIVRGTGGMSHVLARTHLQAHTVVLTARVEDAALPTVMAIWRSLAPAAGDPPDA